MARGRDSKADQRLPGFTLRESHRARALRDNAAMHERTVTCPGAACLRGFYETLRKS